MGTGNLNIPSLSPFYGPLSKFRCTCPSRSDHWLGNGARPWWATWDFSWVFLRWNGVLHGHGGPWRDGCIPTHQVRILGICYSFRGSCVWVRHWLELLGRLNRTPLSACLRQPDLCPFSIAQVSTVSWSFIFLSTLLCLLYLDTLLTLLFSGSWIVRRYLIVTPNNINAAGIVIQYWTRKVPLEVWMGTSISNL